MTELLRLRPAPTTADRRELLRACIHCGLCTSSCPTYVELGDENDGPRGRIQLMRAGERSRRPLGDRCGPPPRICASIAGRAKRPAPRASATAD